MLIKICFFNMAVIYQKNIQLELDISTAVCGSKSQPSTCQLTSN